MASKADTDSFLDVGLENVTEQDIICQRSQFERSSLFLFTLPMLVCRSSLWCETGGPFTVQRWGRNGVETAFNRFTDHRIQPTVFVVAPAQSDSQSHGVAA